MRTIKIFVYKIDDHPDPQKCYQYIRDNLHNLNDHSVIEVIESINALSRIIGGRVDYGISAVPDRGEYIRFKDYSHEELFRLSADDCPLTGVCWDIDLIEGLKKGIPELVLKALHNSTEELYSDQGLYDLCLANEYEFTEDGKYI